MRSEAGDQRTTVLVYVESEEYEIDCGSKQGGLLSSFLFNSVLHSPIEKDIGISDGRGLGIKLGDEKKRDCISNLSFADDVLMMANAPK